MKETYTTIMTHTIGDNRIALHQTDEGELVITNSFINKAYHCFSWELAMDVFDTCVRYIENTWAYA